MRKRVNEDFRLWKFFICFFLVGFLVLNWSNISWIFNYFSYDFIGAKLSGFFENIELEQVKAIEIKNGVLTIPKIKVKAPIQFTSENKELNFDEILSRGVLHYPLSSLPGENGQVIILGHSAPLGWPEINYDKVFSKLGKIERGDEIFIDFDTQRYVYRADEKEFLEQGEEVSFSEPRDNSSQLILLSCWPPGKSQKRIAIKAELISH